MSTVPKNSTPQVSALFASYRPPAGGYDELFDSNGALRPHWTGLVAMFDALGRDELVRRWAQADTLLEENGITYDVYGDPHGVNRPWAFDPFPLVLGPPDWQVIEAAVAQRAHVFNALLADIYGPQHLLKSGTIPPEFVFANPAFLRPCHGIRPPQGCYLHFYAADLARSADGSWAIFADRTQAPSGAGYALENRVVTGRVFPNLIRDCHVQRLASFFDKVRTGLREISPRKVDNPNVVLLSSGQFSQTYFEHAYLARYLGYALVEDEDLTMRDNAVFVKTLEGLDRVDVILRRLDDQFCDPLEFHGDSTTGLVGLVQAIHAKSVALGNALGSGVLEAPALRALIPELCRELRGEDIKLPAIPTWWCARESDRLYVEANFNDLIVGPAFTSGNWQPVAVSELTAEKQEALRKRIAARPYEFVAQARVLPSTMPVWTAAGWEPHPLVLRTFATRTREGYTVMPGGLTRHLSSADRPVMSMLSGGGSKDTWVLTEGPIDTLSLLPPPGAPLEIRRAVTNLPSRAADNLFWMGRYLERAEDCVRRVRWVLSRASEETFVSTGEGLGRVLRAVMVEWPGITADTDPKTFEWHVAGAVFDEQWPGSVQSVVLALQRTAWVVRDRLSTDTWRLLNLLIEEWPETGEKQPTPPPGQILVLMNHLITTLAAFSGLAMENMTRSQGFRFLDMGRRVERCQHTLVLLKRALESSGEHESSMVQAVLEISDSSMTYRSRYGGNLQASALLDLLVTDESNPRSIAFQVEALLEHLNALPRERVYPFLSAEQQMLTRISADLRLLDIYDLCRVGPDGTRQSLSASLTEWSRLFRELAEAMMRHYFSHTGAPRTLTSTREAKPE